jgi:hypothetical protein
MKRLLSAILLLTLLVSLFPARTALAQGEFDPTGYLEKQGYTVVDIADGETDKGESYAAVIMDWESKGLWTSETFTQAWHGFYALRGGYPDAKILVPILVYNEQYEVVFRAYAADWDKYQKSQDWNTFARKLFIGIWDNEAGAFLESKPLKDFVNKEWGPAPKKLPEPKPLPGPSSRGVTIKASATQVKPQETADLTITVLDKKNKPVDGADVELSVSGTATGSKVRPRATSTDAKGIAEATFTAGNTEGSAIITAESMDTRGTITIQVGAGKEDPSAKVIAPLEQQGYKVYGAGPTKSDPNTVVVDMDLAGYFVDESGNADPETLTQVAYGFAALADAYPEATFLVVITRYQSTYGIVWPAKRQDLEALVDEKMSAQDFWAGVFSAMAVIDLETGEEVPIKDFIHKNFMGG